MGRRLEEFASKYFTICEAMGKPMNGINRAQFVNTLAKTGAETVLEMLDTIEKYESLETGIKDE